LSRGELNIETYVWEVSMSQAKNGDTLKVHFTGGLENGEVSSNSKDD
jgi:FKBP-type peptidyl-prolyl cis-trans isomerase